MGDKEETEVVMDTEKEQQAGDKAEARGEPNWQEIMKIMAEQSRQNNENLIRQINEKNNENFRK